MCTLERAHIQENQIGCWGVDGVVRHCVDIFPTGMYKRGWIFEELISLFISRRSTVLLATPSSASDSLLFSSMIFVDGKEIVVFALSSPSFSS